MQKTEHIVRYTAEELDEILRYGGDQTNWERVRALTEEEIEASIDHEDEGEFDMTGAQAGLPDFLQPSSVSLDPNILAWFKAQGPDYKFRINAALREYIATHDQ